MKAVSNTSPLCYLILIQEIQVLPELFAEIVIPPAVRDELAHPDAPAQVREWIADPPEWLLIGEVSVESKEQEILRLDPGEREAILLAERLGTPLLLLDDWQAEIERSLSSSRACWPLSSRSLAPSAEWRRMARHSLRSNPSLLAARLSGRAPRAASPGG